MRLSFRHSLEETHLKDFTINTKKLNFVNGFLAKVDDAYDELRCLNMAWANEIL